MVEKNNYETLGVVVIGRNEGKRLYRCLNSIVNQVKAVIYVDSGSTDNSVAMAESLGVEIVELDLSDSFTAARARNSGYAKLYELNPDLKYVQFVDGDCEIQSAWFEYAINYLETNSNIGVVCGRVHELHPEHSIYNMLCDIEWDTPVGNSKACGGNFMTRFNVFNNLTGFREKLIAGEESEFCLRLRQEGWLVWRLDHDMALHDANITRFSQWWLRSIRGGYAYAEGAYLHGLKQERHRVRNVQRILFWGLVLPLIITILASINSLGLILLFVYPLQILRLAIQGKRSTRENWIYASFLILEKFPGMIGVGKFILHLLTGRRGILIEYK